MSDKMNCALSAALCGAVTLGCVACGGYAYLYESPAASSGWLIAFTGWMGLTMLGIAVTRAIGREDA